MFFVLQEIIRASGLSDYNTVERGVLLTWKKLSKIFAKEFWDWKQFYAELTLTMKSPLLCTSLFLWIVFDKLEAALLSPIYHSLLQSFFFGSAYLSFMQMIHWSWMCLFIHVCPVACKPVPRHRVFWRRDSIWKLQTKIEWSCNVNARSSYGRLMSATAISDPYLVGKQCIFSQVRQVLE